MNKTKRTIVSLIAAMLVLAFLPSVMGAKPVGYEASMVSARHYNVMIVVDGSGSLTGRRATDSEGYRFDAVQLFLGLMTNSGNYVGAIVFDDKDPMPLNTELLPISGSVAKRNLAKSIREAKAGGDTDIGGALLEATRKLQALQKENGLPSVVVLMSDGMTDLSTDEALKRSYADEERAIQECKDNNIPVFSVLLNKDGKLESTGELEKISTMTGGSYKEVKTSADLSDVYTLFYSLIYSSDNVLEGLDKSNVFTFDDNGKVIIKQVVPEFGVEEMNLVANSPSGIDSISVISPSGETLKESVLEDEIIRSDNYEFLKIEEPIPGEWTFEISGEAGNEVKIDLIYNSDLGLSLSKPDQVFSFEGGEIISAQVTVLDGNDAPISNPAAYNAEYIKAYLSNQNDPSEKYEMKAASKGNCFEISVPAPELDSSASYVIQAEYTITGIQVKSNTLVVDVNPVTIPEVNNPPKAANPSIEHEVKDSGDGFDYIPIEGLFTDEDGDELTYAIASSDYPAGDVSIENGRIRISRKVLDGSFSLRATDGKSSAMVRFNLKGNAKPVAAMSSTKIQIETNKLFGGKAEEVISIGDWFSDADGDPLEYSIIACDYDFDKDGTITISPEQKTLTVKTKGFKKSNLVLRATDPAGANAEMTVHFTVMNWWYVYGGVITAVLIGVGALGVAALIRYITIRFKGYIMVRNVSEDSYANDESGFRTPYPSQRKKLVLNSLYGVDRGDFDRKCCIYPLSNKKIRFKSPKPFFYNGRKVKYVDVGMDSSVTIYASDADDTNGLLIATESPDNFGSEGGGFGGDDNFGSSSSGSSGGFDW